MPDWFHADTYWLARLLLQRGLAVVYFVAFAVALVQFRPLLGERGLLPVTKFLAVARFREAPSLFHWRYSDRLLAAVALAGMVLSLVVVSGFPDRWPIAVTVATWLALWALYLSIVNVGQRFYGFGWETLLLEAGFLASFLGPAWSAVPLPVILLFRWLLVRVELGAGLIKLRGDACWRNLTCLDYHHETQPMPNPLSWYFHQLPKPLHRLEVLGSHFAQLVAPALLLFPQPIATVGGAVMAGTQLWLVLSGNFSWLNLITIVLTASAIGHPAHASTSVVAWHDGLVVGVTLLVVALSYRPAKNLFSKEQLMNASFDPLHLVNTYGAFGHVTRERYEIVLEGTTDDVNWVAYEFKGKPTDVMQRPRQWAPYHLRLDWMMWFAAMSSAYRQPWFRPFVVQLLRGDRATLRLLGKNPFPGASPRAIRARLFLYRFTTWRERRETGAFWSRTFVEDYLPPVRLDEVETQAQRRHLDLA